MNSRRATNERPYPWTTEKIFARKSAQFRLDYYLYKYGQANVWDLTPIEFGNGYELAVSLKNVGRTQKKLDCGDALICEDKLIFTDRPREGLSDVE